MSRHQQDSPAGRAVVTAGLIWLLYTYPLQPHWHPHIKGAWWFGALLAAIGVLRSLPGGFGRLGDVFKLRRAFRRDDPSKGSSGWMTPREAWRLGLHKRRKGSQFIGIAGAVPIYLATETHTLVIGPAGSAKTSSKILPLLCGAAESALINDIKGELFEVTADYRRRWLGHRVEKIEPGDPANSACINPMDPISDAVDANDPTALTWARGMALQLHPNPKGGAGQNEFFYLGTRGQLSTIFLAICATMPKEHRTITTAFRMVYDTELLHDLLERAMKSPKLNGEIADLAASLFTAAFGENGAAKTFEQYRLGSVQALEAFGPGSTLASITARTTVDLRDLKREKLSLYIIVDYASSAVLGKFSGLVQWLAAELLVREENNKPVLFVLDEFCNSPVYKLPEILTLLRTYGVRCVLATQDLEDISRVYGKEALATILSETDIKQFLSIRSQTTLDWLSKYLGDATETGASYAMGRDGVQETISQTSRKLLNPDEIRRLAEDAQIVLKGNLKPLLLKKVQVFAISPWRKRIAPNSLYGGKRKLSRVEVRVRWLGTEVTWRGQRAWERIWRKATRPAPSAFWRGLGRIFGGAKPGVGLFVVIALAAAIWAYGAPNLRWEYAFTHRDARGAPSGFVWCSYLGPTSPGVIGGPDCPLILWRRTW